MITLLVSSLWFQMLIAVTFFPLGHDHLVGLLVVVISNAHWCHLLSFGSWSPCWSLCCDFKCSLMSPPFLWVMITLLVSLLWFQMLIGVTFFPLGDDHIVVSPCCDFKCSLVSPSFLLLLVILFLGMCYGKFVADFGFDTYWGCFWEQIWSWFWAGQIGDWFWGRQIWGLILWGLI